jgi:hypothetical protein
MKAAQLGIQLRGDRNQCSGCSKLFNSSHAFDKHRAGMHADNSRYCLDAVEMRKAGMVLGADGFWRGSSMTQDVLKRVSA